MSGSASQAPISPTSAASGTCTTTWMPFALKRS